ncbi:hypothetical protein ACFXP7_06290 [Microbacterium sp. P06]|uniref:hypothetical protein n=1 Tax=Microbacterium sp. P06 TaxID=3366949 RepID=UPI003746817A
MSARGRGRDGRVPEKRPAFEVPAALDRPAADPAMKRPIATTAGAGLVLLRVAAGVVWTVSVALDWDGWVRSYTGETADAAGLTPDVLGIGLAAFLVVCGLFLLGEAVFGLLILGGRNFPRMVVMIFSTLSISTAFTGWWVQGQDIRLDTTLITLALDILVLLALSSRGAAAYAHRRRRD